MCSVEAQAIDGFVAAGFAAAMVEGGKGEGMAEEGKGKKGGKSEELRAACQADTEWNIAHSKTHQISQEQREQAMQLRKQRGCAEPAGDEVPEDMFAGGNHMSGRPKGFWKGGVRFSAASISWLDSHRFKLV